MITDPREKIALRIEVQADGCWTWDGPRLPAGYGRVWHGGKHWLAHRLSYESFVGPIPDGLTIDHLCLEKSCVNFQHLEAVPLSENSRRGSTRRVNWPSGRRATHCRQGHPRRETPMGKWYCPTCRSRTKRSSK